MDYERAVWRNIWIGFGLAVLVMVAIVLSLAWAFSARAADKDDSTIYLTEPITEGLADTVRSRVKEIKAQKLARLLIVIDSPGGNMLAGLDIIRTLRASEIPTTCQAEGVAASMAFIILQSNACGERLVRPYTLLMAHTVSLGHDEAQTREHDAERLRRRLHAFDLSIASMIAERIGLQASEYLALVYHDDMWAVGEEAVQRGMADKSVPLGPAVAK